MLYEGTLRTIHPTHIVKLWNQNINLFTFYQTYGNGKVFKWLIYDHDFYFSSS